MIWKLELKWSAPCHIISRTKNSYKLETLEGLPIGGRFSSWHLWCFIPRDGTSLQEVQRAVEEALGLAEEEADAGGEVEDVDVAEDVENIDMGEEADGINDPISEGDSGEKGGLEEGLGDDENGDDRENASGVQRAAEDKDMVSDQAEEEITSDKGNLVPEKGPRRSKRLQNFLSRVLKRARS